MKLVPVRNVCSGFLVVLILSVVSACGIVPTETSASEQAEVGAAAGVGNARLAKSDAAPGDVAAQHKEGGNGAPNAGRKYHPGHYVDLLKYQSAGNDDRYLLQALRPGVAGIQKRYAWRDLEPQRDRYDFSRIDSDLKLLAARQSHLIIVVGDKSFKNEQDLPDYLAAYSLPNRKGGYTTQRWDRNVIERWVKLMQALGARFDGNPNFEGVATEESALSLDEDQLRRSGYTPEKYRDALIEILRRTAEAMPRSRVFWTMNFLPDNQRYIAQIAAAVASQGVVMGGPDVLPDSPAVKRLAYPFYHQFQGRVPLFCVVMPNSYRHPHKSKSSTKYWTMEELYEFARDELHLNYMLWTYVPSPKPEDSYDIEDAFPVMERHPVINAGDFGSNQP